MHFTERFALALMACVWFYDCRESVCMCERDRDGWILWADVYEVWSKWSEKLSSWQRTRSRLEKKMGDSHTHMHATMIQDSAQAVT